MLLRKPILSLIDCGELLTEQIITMDQSVVLTLEIVGPSLGVITGFNSGHAEL